jgi:hypothetical protein
MDPVAILDSLDARAIEERLSQLRGERQALLTLLRASRARERVQKYARQQGGEAPHCGREGGR